MSDERQHRLGTRALHAGQQADPATCSQMKRIDLAHLALVRDNLADGRVVNRISVAADVAALARVAPKRTIDIKAAVGLTLTSSSQGGEK